MLPVLQIIPSITWGQFSTFFDYSKIATLTGAEAVGVAFVLGVILVMIFKHLFSLGLLLAALVAVLVLTGVASFSLSSASAFASQVWTFLSQFTGGILTVIANGGVDGLVAFGFGAALGWFGIPFIRVHSD